MEKTKKIIAIVAACLVMAGAGLGVGYKLWFNEDMPTVDVEATVNDSVVASVDSVVTVDTVEVVK